jgi:hypothetical protein
VDHARFVREHSDSGIAAEVEKLCHLLNGQEFAVAILFAASGAKTPHPRKFFTSDDLPSATLRFRLRRRFISELVGGQLLGHPTTYLLNGGSHGRKS